MNDNTIDKIIRLILKNHYTITDNGMVTIFDSKFGNTEYRKTKSFRLSFSRYMVLEEISNRFLIENEIHSIHILNKLVEKL